MQSHKNNTETDVLSVTSKIWLTSQVRAEELKKMVERVSVEEQKALQQLEMYQELMLEFIGIVNLHHQFEEIATIKNLTAPSLPDSCTRKSVLDLSDLLRAFAEDFKKNIQSVPKSYSNPEYISSPSWEIVKHYNHEELALWAKLDAEYLKSSDQSLTLREENLKQFLSTSTLFLTEISKLKALRNTVMELLSLKNKMVAQDQKISYRLRVKKKILKHCKLIMLSCIYRKELSLNHLK